MNNMYLAQRFTLHEYIYRNQRALIVTYKVISNKDKGNIRIRTLLLYYYFFFKSLK
jgi:hypothetical protein